jgi:hypothetical protein
MGLHLGPIVSRTYGLLDTAQRPSGWLGGKAMLCLTESLERGGRDS